MATAKKVPAKKTAAKKSPAKKSPAKKSPASASDEAAALWELCEQHAGNPEGLNALILSSLTSSDPAAMGRSIALQRGTLTGLYALFLKLSRAIDPQLLDYFDDLVRKGATKPATHKSNTPGALCFVGVCLGSWAEFERYVRSTLGPMAKLDALRQLEVEVCARHLIEAREDEGGLEFIRGRIRAWSAAIDQRESSDAGASRDSLPFLLRRRDAAAISALNDALERASFSGANWWVLMDLVKKVLAEARWPELQPGMKRAVEKGLGRHDDGDRATVLRAYAACGASEEALREASAMHKDVRGECERAAVAAGVIELAPSKRAVTEARAAIEALFDKRGGLGSMEFGAAASLVRAMVERGAKGTDELVERVRDAGHKCKWAEKSLLEWLDRAAAQ
ncbi:MAG: hypothetical protein U0269_27840 [Polyangiales bacterium]